MTNKKQPKGWRIISAITRLGASLARLFGGAKGKVIGNIANKTANTINEATTKDEN